MIFLDHDVFGLFFHSGCSVDSVAMAAPFRFGEARPSTSITAEVATSFKVLVERTTYFKRAICLWYY